MSVIARQKPDFSGDWTLNRQASTLSPAAAAFQSGVMRIDHREPVFRCQATYVADGKPVEYVGQLQQQIAFGMTHCIVQRLEIIEVKK